MSRSSSSRLSGRFSTSLISVGCTVVDLPVVRCPWRRGAACHLLLAPRGVDGTSSAARDAPSFSGDAVGGELGGGEPPHLPALAVDLAHLERAVVETVEAAGGDEQPRL